jgi:hypothetical protein
VSAFIFRNQEKAKAVCCAEVPVGIRSKDALLDALYIALRFPDYFGGNWDALNECIRDLSWLPDGDVILRHGDLPMLEDRASLSTYLSILNEATEKWRATGKRKLLVTFPSDTQKIVESILAEAGRSES